MWKHSGIVLDPIENPSGELDISNIVGANTSVVLFKAVEAGQGQFGSTRFFRAGNTTSTRSADYIQFAPTKLSGYVIGITNSLGCVPISGNVIVTLTVVGYDHISILSSSIFGPASLGQEIVDISPIIPNDSLVFLAWEQSAGSESGCKSRLANDQSDHAEGANTCWLSSIEPTAMTITPTNLGELSLIDPNVGVEEIVLLTAIGSSDGWHSSFDIVFQGTPPVDWTTLDLSAIVGAQTSLVVLRLIITPDLEEFAQYFSFKPNNDAAIDYLPDSYIGMGSSSGFSNFGQCFYVVTETDPYGIIKWKGIPSCDVEVNILGYVDEAEPLPDLYVDSVISSHLSMRVMFNGPVVNDSELRNPKNYIFSPLLSESVIGIECISVTPQSRVQYPTYVDLELSDCRNDAEYTLNIVNNRIQNSSGSYIESNGNSKVYTGVSNQPSVLLAVAISETSYRVVFSKMMAINDDIVNPSKYTFSDGLKCLKVHVENSSSVILTTTKQTIGRVYTLTVG